MKRSDLYAAIRSGLADYHRERFFEAHEAWEEAWREAEGPERPLLQGLIQLAAALHKNAQGNARGRHLNLEKSEAKLRAAAEQSLSVASFDLIDLGQKVSAALTQSKAAGDNESIAAPKLPRCAGPDGILYLHGFASSPSSAKAQAIVPPLVREGLHVAVPDQNEGNFRALTISRAIRLAQRNLRDRTLVIGSSLGGYVAALLALREDRVRSMLLLAPAFDFATRLERRYGGDAIDAWRQAGQVMVEHYGYDELRPIGFELFEDAHSHAAFPPIQVPTTILHGRFDETVPVEGSVHIAQTHPANVRLEVLDDDHALTGSSPIALEHARQLAHALGLAPDPAPLDSED